LLAIFEKWKDRITKLVATKIRLMQLDIIERIAKLMSYFIMLLVFIFIGFGALLFTGFSCAEWFSSLLDNRALGNLATAAVFVLLILILYVQRKRIMIGMSNKFISALSQDEPEAKDTETTQNQ
jgi:hypothetical protein